MSIQVAIRHNTKYAYDRPIKMWPQTIRLRPAPHSRTKILGYSMNILPENHFINWLQDPFGNYQARIVFPDLVKEFVIDVEVIAELESINPFDFFLEEYAEKFPFKYEESLKTELTPYLETTENGPLLQKLKKKCEQFLDSGMVDFLVAVNRVVHEELSYSIRMEPGVQSCETTLNRRLGSCRDFAWLLVMLFRHFGLAARFVSGYLVQLTPDVREPGVPSGPDHDFTDLHAWAEVYIPGAGWIGLDATSGLFASEGHIPLACTPKPESAAPVTGATEITNVKFHFENIVERIYESPRVTKPYTDIQLKEFREFGCKIDELYENGDIRMTMGGEPTFISGIDMESDQWNSDADGKDKRNISYELSQDLLSKFGSGGIIHFGQGKWYPGEPIPRWQYALLWRKDGIPIWENPKLIGNPNVKGSYDLRDLKKFTKMLAKNLGLSKDYIAPAYEDKYYYLWEENNLPVDFNPVRDLEKAKIERQTLLELINNIDQEVGYVLPLRYDVDQSIWESCFWKFNRKKLFLIPGNSQIGLRLPLDRLPVKTSKLKQIVIPYDPIQQNEDLNEITAIKSKIALRQKAVNNIEYTEEETETFTTALCTQIVNGNINIFLPPIEEMKHALELIHAIEMASEELGFSVIIEGYQLPFHHKIEKLVVAPDPGVVEINIHPSKSWSEILTNYDILFEAAKKVGLDTNKFMLDGRHTGTGGGNHITLGGVTPKDSPLLRRPDLLRSMINFWQNHPSLSYLFSSAFVGPTSQAPRVDEGRPDAIYELEIAFNELENHNNPPFWLVDRIFRNLLTDLTGNTHRAEFCIDKLYSPDSSSGRLGILELRGFDMPPHKDMCLVQLLLIRSLVAMFWNNPYKQKLIDWRTDLHNKFMMHHYVKEDMIEVVEMLNRAKIEFKHEWLEIFYDFRFPILGQINLKGVKIILRAAIEPWTVLGEEMSSQGTARFVDSSVERIEVKVENFNPERYMILCNGVEVPMTHTASKNSYVASVRYKAWAPPSALHPTIEIDTPLVFDLYDQWNERSIGGCTYHVMHPGGRSYDTYPVNALEAESRRTTRFWEFNHSPKVQSKISDQTAKYTTKSSYVVNNENIKENIKVIKTERNRYFPDLLDLRKTKKIG